MFKYVISFFLLFSFISCQKKQSIKPTFGPVVESVYAIGSVKSHDIYNLKVGVLTSVRKFYVKEGDLVKEGDRLLTLDSGVTLKSLISGVVTTIPVNVGETVSAQQTILSVVNLEKVYLEASLEQNGALKMKQGQKVLISFESFRSQTFSGVVQNIIPREGEFVVQVTVSDLPENILPGMNADLSIEINKKDKALLVPVGAISNGSLTLLRNGKKEKVKVEIGISDSEFAEILSPELSADDEILMLTQKNPK
jgi:multidrug efflux pump subunit AcrA (membrane-fusion protein)